MGFFDGLQNGITNPLFLGGAALMSGGGAAGMMQGLKAGNQFEQQRKAEAEQQAQKQRFQGLFENGAPFGVPDAYAKMAQVAGPQQGMEILAQGLPKRAAPMSPLQQAKLQHQRLETERLRQTPIEPTPPVRRVNVSPTRQPQGLDADGNLIFTSGDDALLGQSSRVGMGGTGLTSPEIPGIVVSPKSGKTDVDATRAYQGQLADERRQASPDDRRRLQEARDVQAYWTSLYGNKPPSGKAYTKDGGLIDLQGKSSATERATWRTVGVAKQGLRSALSVLTDKSLLNNVMTRAAANYGDYGEVGQAFADFNQSAMQIVYALSGKQSTWNEMKAILKAYGPKPLDSQDRIKMKAERVENYLRALAQREGRGKEYEAILGDKQGESESEIDSNAINMLRSDPSPQAQAEFDDVFGPGAAQRVLGQ